MTSPLPSQAERMFHCFKIKGSELYCNISTSASISDSQISWRFQVSTSRILSSSCWGRDRSRPWSTGGPPPCSPPCRAASRAPPPPRSGRAAPAWTSGPAGRRWGRRRGGLSSMRSLQPGTLLSFRLLGLTSQTDFMAVDNLPGDVDSVYRKCNWEFDLTETLCELFSLEQTATSHITHCLGWRGIK